MIPKSPHQATGHALAWTILMTTGATLLHVSFEAWGDAIIDLGRDLYLPSQILEGRVLFRELLYNYGPLTPYLLAAITWAFGDGLGVFAAFGGLVGLATLGALYAIGVRLAGVLSGFACAFLFLLLNFFAASTWGCNFVLPYSFAATLATALSLWSFYFLLRYTGLPDSGFSNPADEHSPRHLAWSVTLLFATLLCKQEVGLGIGAVHFLAWLTHKIPRRAILWTLGSGVLVGGLFIVLFTAHDSSEHALFAENLAKFAGDPDPFFSVVAGLDQPGPHLLRTLTSTGQLTALLFLAALSGTFITHSQLGRKAAGTLALASAIGLVWIWGDVRLFQATPILALVALSFFLVRDRRDPLVLLAAYALFSAPRVLLQFHPMWYGFYLVVPAYPFLVYGLGVRTAERLPNRRVAVLVLATLVLVLTGRFESSMLKVYEKKTSVLETSRGFLRDFPSGRQQAIGEFLEYAETHIKPRTTPDKPTLVVMPEGVSLNYFTGFPNPTAYYLFTPPEIGSPEVEQRMIRELGATRPDYLVMTSRDVSEYGKRGIGVDYAMQLGDWIRGSYDLEQIFEAGEKPWRLLLLRRRDKALPQS